MTKENDIERKEATSTILYCTTCAKELYSSTKSFAGQDSLMQTIANLHLFNNPGHSMTKFYDGKIQ